MPTHKTVGYRICWSEIRYEADGDDMTHISCLEMCWYGTVRYDVVLYDSTAPAVGSPVAVTLFLVHMDDERNIK